MYPLACRGAGLCAAPASGAVDGQRNPEDVWLNPVFPFEDWTLETRDAAVDGEIL